MLSDNMQDRSLCLAVNAGARGRFGDTDGAIRQFNPNQRMLQMTQLMGAAPSERRLQAHIMRRHAYPSDFWHFS